MSRSRIQVVRGAAVAAVACCLAAQPALAEREQRVGPAAPAATQPSGVVPDRLIVEWEPGTTEPDRVDAREQADTDALRTLGDARFQLLKVEPGQRVAEAVDRLADDPAVRAVARDHYAVVSSIPNDPYFGQLWGLANVGSGIDGVATAIAGADIQVTAAWDRTVGTPTTVIADIDTGYRFDHPDLAGVAWTNPGEIAGNNVDDEGNGYVDDVHGWDFVGSDADAPYPGDADPTDDDVLTGGHGVHTAGTMAAAGNNGTGTTGVARDVRVMPLRSCGHSDASGAAICPDSAQIAAINYAGRHGARAANMSFGSRTLSPLVRDSIAANPQTLFVIAAGNNGTNNDAPATPTYPCAYDPSTAPVGGAIDNVICVAATDQGDQLADFSNYGARSVDLGAPGTEMLSTYVTFASEERFRETFEAGQAAFVLGWSGTGANGGFVRSSESPLMSTGITDLFGPGTPAPNSVRESTLASGVAIPPGYSGCTLTQTRVISRAPGSTGTYSYAVLLNGTTISAFSATQSGTFALGFTDPALTASGGALKLRFRYAAGATPASGNGVWLDNLVVECSKPSAKTLTYAYEQGTSMAAPHVTGAAALLFSLKPTASVAEVRSAILTTTDPLPALAGRTASGGRLDVSAALDRLVPPDTAIASGPAPTTTSTTAALAFGRADSAVAASFECRLDGAPFTACASPAQYATGLGAHTFEVRAKDVHGNVDLSPASYAWRVLQSCKVPRLKGKTLTQAKRLLRSAHCATGKITKPKAKKARKGTKGRKLPPLVVGSSSPKAGTSLAAAAKVKLTLKAKPKAKAKHKKPAPGRR